MAQRGQMGSYWVQCLANHPIVLLVSFRLAFLSFFFLWSSSCISLLFVLTRRLFGFLAFVVPISVCGPLQDPADGLCAAECPVHGEHEARVQLDAGLPGESQ